MYTIRRKNKIVGSAIDVDKAVEEFLKNTGHSLAADLTETKAIVKRILVEEHKFQWGSVTVTRDK